MCNVIFRTRIDEAAKEEALADDEAGQVNLPSDSTPQELSR